MPNSFSLVTSKVPNVAIIGAGTMGCLYAASLSQTGCKVTLVARRAETAKVINSESVIIEEDGFLSPYPGINAVTSMEQAPKPDLVIVCVKGPDTGSAIASAAGAIPASATVLTLQNGLGNVDAIAEYIPEEQIVVGVSYTGATLLSPGVVRICGRGAAVLGELDGKLSPRLLALVQIFERAGLQPRMSENIKGVAWSKVLVSSGINPIAALTRLKNGELAAHPESVRLMSILVGEGIELSEHLGIALEDSDPVARTLEVALNTGSNTASMLQDILNGRKTEIESINGMLVGKGHEVGLRMPLNRAITLLVRLLEKSTIGRIEKDNS